MQTPEEMADDYIFELQDGGYASPLLDHDQWRSECREMLSDLIRARDAEWTKQFQAEVWARYGIEDRWDDE